MALFPGVALIVGSASGIGQQTAVSFANEGCHRIALLDRSAEGLTRTAALIAALPLSTKAETFTQVVDVLEEASIIAAITAIVKLWGRIDYAVNSAGVTGNNQASTDTATHAFDTINGINYRGTWLCSREELKVMLNQTPLPTHDGRPGNRGSVVNVSSQLALVGRPRASAYCASKSAVIGMTRVDAIDYSVHNIRVNCVCPGIVDTPMTQGPGQAERLKPVISIAPLNRLGTPQEIADAIIFLSSSKASFMQGAAMVVDGGYTIN
ncbi:2-(R)-hydroxypropyl-dehydrogenase [Hyphodiscus hymeniophilus]|uniref:2-(R)-hydroxypropyl-dehydrogenase n=1 Tax=Hyphodiscus hymeniophilus TaxID=353542 RepID=A0A9P6VEG3_9HELO|nr:2-(R)-hydroxypropyl-dehydrogenase [Hyphodiscus hymeniophilus]